MRFKITGVLLASVEVTAGRALWVPGDSHPRYVQGVTIQPTDADVVINDIDNVTTFGFNIAAGAHVSIGNQEIRGTDIQMDLSKIGVFGASEVVLLLEVPDDN